MAVTVPTTTAEVTPEWVTEALREGGSLAAGVEVTSVEVEPIGVGVGLLGELARLRPLYHGDDPSAPASMVLKLPTPAEANRAQALAFGFYEREVRFYRELASTVSLRVPRCYWSHLGDDGFGLLIEDLSTFQMADQVAGISLERAALAVEHIARFHAGWWDTPELEALDWLPYSNGPVTMGAVGVFERGWPLFLDNFGHLLSPEGIAVGERVRDHFAWLLDGLGARPRTIVHTDFRLDNLFFGPPGSPDEVAVIDWQLSTRGRGVYDVAYLLCQSMVVEDRRAHEMDLLRRWHDTLVGAGVEGYDWDEALADYTRGAMICLVIAVSAGADLDLGNERGRALLTALTERSFTAVVDLDAQRLLPD